MSLLLQISATAQNVLIGSITFVSTGMCMLVLITGAYLLCWLGSINADKVPKKDSSGTGGERQRLLPGSPGFSGDHEPPAYSA
ncbi:hypothetical protein BPAE_0048g00070 [Botrytis paeoniae]|uniref:Uncharacterized protein n=1 Tax=Botrytis paeoniae TaxID=278948 RepID=A0A4Z1FQQ8_9HELO|nr:hypothetical protein BPAE_0048g00070 [Botrytis paeoniae]